MRMIAALVFALVLSVSGGQAHSEESIFMLRTTAKSPDAVVAAIEAYSKQHDWVFLGASKVKKGQVTLVKFCIPEVGRLVWPAGLQLSALLPCGNAGVYERDGTTEVSLLHPRFMHMLHPSPETESASDVAEPLLLEMLESVTQ